MKVFVDTNVLFSSFINPGGTAAKAFLKAVSGENETIICRQNVEELKATIAKKYPAKVESLKTYFELWCYTARRPCVCCRTINLIHDAQ